MKRILVWLSLGLILFGCGLCSAEANHSSNRYIFTVDLSADIGFDCVTCWVSRGAAMAADAVAWSAQRVPDLLSGAHLHVASGVNHVQSSFGAVAGKIESRIERITTEVTVQSAQLLRSACSSFLGLILGLMRS
ncbi:hypothetical protein EHM69_10260 [candidate division KSB1 bacterium]|nr:MAG: hypothetical protein EHM69_10260 [candidate division KSB1 bacterium]